MTLACGTWAPQGCLAFSDFGTVPKGIGSSGPILGRPWIDPSDKPLFLCEETGLGDAAMSAKGQGHTGPNIPFYREFL